MPLRWGQIGSNEEVAAKWCPPADGLHHPNWYIDGVGETGRQNAVDVFNASDIMCQIFYQKSGTQTPASVASPSGRKTAESPFTVEDADGILTPQFKKKGSRVFDPVHSFEKKEKKKKKVKTKNMFSGLSALECEESEESSDYVSEEEVDDTYFPTVNNEDDFFGDDPFEQFKSGSGLKWADQIEDLAPPSAKAWQRKTREGEVTTTQISCTIIHHLEEEDENDVVNDSQQKQKLINSVHEQELSIYQR